METKNFEAEKATALIKDEMRDTIWDVKVEIFARLKLNDFYPHDAPIGAHNEELNQILQKLLEES